MVLIIRVKITKLRSPLDVDGLMIKCEDCDFGGTAFDLRTHGVRAVNYTDASTLKLRFCRNFNFFQKPQLREENLLYWSTLNNFHSLKFKSMPSLLLKWLGAKRSSASFTLCAFISWETCQTLLVPREYLVK